jgi:O-antigen/teichoic acid export membrane protein
MKRGLVLNLVSNVLFFLCGYVIHFFLGSNLQAAEYGVVGTIMTVLDFEYMFLSNGARQSIAKEISLSRFGIRDVIMKSVGFQLIVIAFFFALNFFGSTLFGKVLNDPNLAFYFRVAAFLIPANGLFVVLLGINDGLHRFSAGAIINTVYPIGKLSVIPLIIFFFKDDPVLGMEVGYLLALIISIVLGVILLIPARKGFENSSKEKIPFSTVARNTLSFSFFFIMVSLVLSIDTLVVKSVVSPSAMAGYYTGAVNLGKIPYYLVSAFCTIILPVISRNVGLGQFDEAKRQVRQFLLLITAFILPIPVIISASSRDLLVAFYHPSYAVASTTLACLAVSSFFMGVTVLLNMVVTAYSSNRFSDVLSIASLIVVVPLFIISAQHGGIALIAIASMASTMSTMLISYFAVLKRVGNVLSKKVLTIICVNVALWIVVHWLFSQLQSVNLLQIAVVYGAILLCYFVLLLATRLLPFPKKLFSAVVR